LNKKPESMPENSDNHKSIYKSSNNKNSPNRYFDMEKRDLIPWYILVPNLRSGHNVGSIIRTAECFGFSQIHLSGYTPSVDNKALQSASMGTEKWISIKKWETFQDFFKHLDSKYSIIGLETSENSVFMENFHWPKNGVLILGNEELGLSPNLIAKCDNLVKIPLFGKKESLNVANAFSIIAYEIRKFFESEKR